MAKLKLYEYRPAKHIQRQMLVDACRRLTAIAPLTDYTYVGFGGIEFIDFDLFRRALGIARMVSIEIDDSAPTRYEFNRPFAGIDIRFGTASEHLPQLDWSALAIVWLDYTRQLNGDVIQDIELLSRELTHGSVLVVTVNASPGKDVKGRRDKLVGNVGDERVPVGVTDQGLGGWSLADVQWRIMRDAVVEAVRNRSARTSFRQLFNFRYSDGLQMQTFGGIFSSPALERTIEQCRFEDLDFIRDGEEARVIRVPPLTRKELGYLNKQLPSVVAGGGLHAEGLSGADKDDYAAIYRWHPIAP